MKHSLIQVKGLAWNISKEQSALRALTTLQMFFTITIGIVLMLLSLSVSASTLPEYYPDKFPATGTIDRIDIKRGEIGINDSLLKISNNAKVRNLNTEFSTVQTLRARMKIGFLVISINGKPLVTEIWVLPNNYFHNRHTE
ncbi:hypothetical protein MNBD_GAMMA17-2183 [hydrothermal vent metagenome]|uniref:Uncharacterized protein n=1 Tax=hydrothermal vent metagenome TaxID=652676 RepID=A0A3B0ZBY4_9ZZZZ